MNGILNLSILVSIGLGCCLFTTVASDDEARKLIVTSLLEEPYVIRRGGKLVGFIPDLLDEISKNDPTLNFEIKLVMDGQYGSLTNSKWSGMMGELTERRADVAAAAMTVSSRREDYVDFTDPFMDVYLTILLKKNDDGTDPEIKSAKDLVDDPTMHYGCVEDGFTYNFFKTSGVGTTFRSMWNHMAQNPDDIVRSQKTGVKRVRESRGKYAFIMESVTAEYYMRNEPCDLTTVSKLTEVKYALAVPNGSEYREILNRALSNLRSANKIEELRAKWWKGKCSDGGNSAQNLVTSAATLLISQLIVLNLWSN